MFKRAIFILFITISTLNSSSIEIKGQDDKKVILNNTAKKVLLFPMPFASMYISIDNKVDNILGLHGSSNKSLKDSFMLKAYPDIKNLNTELVKSGFTPNIEQVLALKPDLIFQWADQGEHIIEPLRKMGLSVVGVKYGTQEYLQEWIDFMGKSTGNIQKAKEIITWHNDIKEKLSTLASKQQYKPEILSLQFSKDRIRVAGDGSYDNFIIELIGAKNVAKNDIRRFADISKEQLLKYNPDVIILGTFDDETPEEFMKRDIFQNLNAVKNKQVYKFPTGGYRWGVPHIEIPLTWVWMYNLVYADNTINLNDMIKSSYKSLYNYEINDKQIDEILNFSIHKNSKNYHLFK